MAKFPAINKGPKKEENRSKASGNAAYFSRGKEYSPGYEKSVTITPPGKKRSPSKVPDRQKQAQAWMKSRRK